MMQALLNLANRPSYLKPLVHEVEDAVRAHGWTKNCINTLCLLDSFFKESMRMNGLASSEYLFQMLSQNLPMTALYSEFPSKGSTGIHACGWNVHPKGDARVRIVRCSLRQGVL